MVCSLVDRGFSFKPLSTNEHTIGDIFSFADDLQEMEISDHDILVSYDVSALFTNVPVDETIGILATKAFKDDWFSEEYNLNITDSEADLIELLEVSKQLLDEVFVISRIIKVEVRVISRSRRLRLITLTETLIILDITKTESNNCFIIH